MMATEKRPTKKQQADADKAAALAELHKLLKPGDTVYCVLRHASASGMSRRIDFYTIKDNQHVFLSGYIARTLGYKFAPKGSGLVVGGCGMDMGFAVVYELSRTMFPKGFAVAPSRCYTCKGTGNAVSAPDYEKCFDCQGKGEIARGRNGDRSGWDEDGGYALKSSWL